METNTNTVVAVISDMAENPVGLTDILKKYGDLFVNGLYLVVLGLLAVYILHRVASRFIYRYVKNRRAVWVVFGFLYALVLATSILLAMEKIGIDVQNVSRITLLVLMVSAVLLYFLIPFLPRLPFSIGHMVEISGELGMVDSISHFHTVIRRLDGTMVFIANPMVLAGKILNYHQTPHRRIELALSVNNDSELQDTIDLFLQLMKEDERVSDEPAPPAVYVVNVTASGVDLTAYCWVKNADWFRARSDLWLKINSAFLKDQRYAMSLPQQEVYVKNVPNPGEPS